MTTLEFSVTCCRCHQVGSWITPRPSMAPMVETLPLVAGWQDDLCPSCVAIEERHQFAVNRQQHKGFGSTIWTAELIKDIGRLRKTHTWPQIAEVMSKRLRRPLLAQAVENAWWHRKGHAA